MNCMMENCGLLTGWKYFAGSTGSGQDTWILLQKDPLTGHTLLIRITNHLVIENGIYRVGPLARLNVATRMKTPLAQTEFENFKKINAGKPVHGTFYFHYAQTD